MAEYSQYEWSHITDPRSTRDLLALAVQPESEDADDPRWDAITSLHYRPTREVFDAAAKLCVSENAHERATGADILGQLGSLRWVYVNERVEMLLRLLAYDTNPKVLKNAAIALGHIKDSRAIEPLCIQAAHSEALARYGAVHGLMAQPDPRAIAALIQLSDDVESNTRDWATFALGSQIDTDTPEIRAALWKRIEDEDYAVRAEAYVGLANRGDTGILEALIAELDNKIVGDGVVEAAGILSDARLVPPLEKLALNCPGDGKILDALESCRNRQVGERQ